MSQSIFNGQSVQLPIQIGEKLTVVAVSGTYSVVVVDGVGDGSTLASSVTGGTYGPYAYSSVVQITSSALSEIDYDVGVTTNIVSDTVVKAASDPLTRGISLQAGAIPLKATAFGASLYKSSLGPISMLSAPPASCAVGFGGNIAALTSAGVPWVYNGAAKTWTSYGAVSGIA